MAEKKPRIIVVKSEFTAAQVAEDAVSKTVKSAEVMDAVESMAGDFVPDETSVLVNEELGLVFAEMTDSEAEKLAGRAGIEAVEEDEEVFALSDIFDDGDQELGEFVEEDEEAALDIDEALSSLENLSDEDLMDVAPSEEDVNFVSKFAPDLDDVDIDDSGELLSLGEPVIEQAEAAGIPQEKILEIVECILKHGDGKIDDVSDDKVKQILSEHDVSTSSAATRAIRDYITCGLRMIGAPYAWRYSTGAGVRVAVGDTGIAPRHPDLRVYGGYSAVPGVRGWYDDHGHGSHVAGTIAARANGRGVIGVAPHARLYAVKVLDRRGRGRLSWILNGLAWCYRYRMHIVNLSLGSGARTHNPRVYSRAYEYAGRRLRRRGILAVAAAGNSGRTRYPFVGNPARCPSYMAVSAVDCRGRRASFSSYGPQVEITAPGVNVWSTYPATGYRQLSGTSMAAPHVSGVAALVKRRHPTWSGDRIRVYLWRTARDLGRPGRDWFFGYGLVNAYRAVR